MTHRIALIAFDGFQLLDLSGPASVYGAANDALGKAAYEVIVTATAMPDVRSGCGVAVTSIQPETVAHVDSLFIMGGNKAGLTSLIADHVTRDWTIEAAARATRFGSICSGSVALAAWDMIGTRRFASHWSAAPYIRAQWPQLDFDGESIFVNDGNLWTSAGVTTGIDMTLAIVEADYGADIARTIAQRLILSVRRPGWQSQFSPALAAQSGHYVDLIAWIALNLEHVLGVETLAERAGETVRSFHRNFARATGKSPAAYVTAQKLALARRLIEDGTPLKSVATRTGFADVARLSAAFSREFGMGANAYRIVHSGG